MRLQQGDSDCRPRRSHGHRWVAVTVMQESITVMGTAPSPAAEGRRLRAPKSGARPPPAPCALQGPAVCRVGGQDVRGAASEPDVASQ
eukprot:353800-Chlamydomonas_euryale.AAC.4